jgi:hypothetical protein
MSRLDHVVDEGRFRAVAAASLDGTTGTWGTTDTGGVGDLLCVQVDANGELIAAAADACDGVIWIPEGRRESFRVSDVEQNTIVGGKTYTVFERAIIAEMETGEAPLAAGDRLFAAAAGAVAGTGTVPLGVALPNPITGGVRFLLRVT